MLPGRFFFEDDASDRFPSGRDTKMAPRIASRAVILRRLRLGSLPGLSGSENGRPDSFPGRREAKKSVGNPKKPPGCQKSGSGALTRRREARKDAGTLKNPFGRRKRGSGRKQGSG